MNSTQKLAWIFLFSALMSGLIFVYVGSVVVFGRRPPWPFGQTAAGAAALACLAWLPLTIFFLTRRQSPAEPESDERDNMIRGKAAAISFVGTWLLLAVALLTLGLTLGQTGSVPVYLLTVILWGIAVTALLIYGAAVLIQYGRTNKGEEP